MLSITSLSWSPETNVFSSSTFSLLSISLIYTNWRLSCSTLISLSTLKDDENFRDFRSFTFDACADYDCIDYVWFVFLIVNLELVIGFFTTGSCYYSFICCLYYREPNSGVLLSFLSNERCSLVSDLADSDELISFSLVLDDSKVWPPWPPFFYGDILGRPNLLTYSCRGYQMPVGPSK